MDITSKRKLKEVIRGLIGDGFIGTQADIAKQLKSKGFKVTQSTVSRTLNEMGVTKELSNGKQIYRLGSGKAKSQYRGSLSELVTSINSNDVLIVIKTSPGSAMFIAGFIDHECSSSVLGTVAGDDTIFVAPKNIEKLQSTRKEIERTIGINH